MAMVARAGDTMCSCASSATPTCCSMAALSASPFKPGTRASRPVAGPCHDHCTGRPSLSESVPSNISFTAVHLAAAHRGGTLGSRVSVLLPRRLACYAAPAPRRGHLPAPCPPLAVCALALLLTLAGAVDAATRSSSRVVAASSMPVDRPAHDNRDDHRSCELITTRSCGGSLRVQQQAASLHASLRQEHAHPFRGPSTAMVPCHGRACRRCRGLQPTDRRAAAPARKRLGGRPDRRLLGCLAVRVGHQRRQCRPWQEQELQRRSLTRLAW